MCLRMTGLILGGSWGDGAVLCLGVTGLILGGSCGESTGEVVWAGLISPPRQEFQGGVWLGDSR